ncbi:MAG: hypothetical protein K2P80_05250 [Beijerinckiaceae bacterium]|nr:hypothetical protein [Beijerinckiaceae bacterium]
MSTDSPAEAAKPSSQETLRQRFSYIAIGVAWALALLSAAICVALSSAPLAVSAVVALAPSMALTVLWRSRPTAMATQIASAAVLVSSVALLVGLLDGHPWQIDMHMAFFAVLAILSGWCAWEPLVAGAGIIALHHLILSVAMTGAVFPDANAAIARVLMHAAIVIVQTSVLLWVVWTLNRALERGDRQTEAALQAGAERLAIERQAHASLSNDRRGVLDTLIERFQGSVAEVLAEVDANAAKTRSTAVALSSETAAAEALTAKVASSADEISSNTRRVADAIDALVTGVGEISRQTSDSTGKITAMAEAAEKTEAVVASLDQAAERIVSITALIQNVADRTNLLSLNATIEAARAGAIGRGFAVVASEVKTLALETMNSTREIHLLVTDIQEQIRSAVKSTGAMSDLAREAMASAAAITDVVEQQSAVTRDMARSVNETSAGTEKLASSFGGVVSVITGANRSVMLGQSVSSGLATSAETLRVAVDDFLAQVKQA